MKVFENEQVYFWDIDNTMISGRRRGSDHDFDEVKIYNPYTCEMVYTTPNFGHIDLMKEMKGRGRANVVWSAAGAQWAKAVIEALELQSYVDLIITKPLGYVDDQKASEFMSNHIYLNPGDRS